MSIYVEILIRGGMDDLWEKTQEPKLHQRWDLRFSEIDYLPRGPDEAQRFLYATRIGAGFRIEGAGESMGERDDSGGERTSALKFWSDDSKSLIKIGSGYWKYIPDSDGIRFITWYDYRTRFGIIGRIVDKIFFRPLLGWATAWSFDRLRLWIERGVLPEVSRDRTLAESRRTPDAARRRNPQFSFTHNHDVIGSHRNLRCPDTAYFLEIALAALVHIHCHGLSKPGRKHHLAKLSYCRL